MMFSKRFLRLLIMAPSLALAACGATVPQLKEAWDKDYPGDSKTNTPPINATSQIEFEIKKQIFCDLRSAVIKANTFNSYDIVGGKKIYSKTQGYIPDDWGADVSLTLEVDESSALNPGVVLNTPLVPAATPFAPTTPFAQSFNLGLGGTLSSTSTRTDKFDSYYTIKRLNIPIDKKLSMCNPDVPKNDPFRRIDVEPATSSPLIVSDLGLSDWLVGAMFTNKLLPSDHQPHKPETPKDLSQQRAKLKIQGYTPAEITQTIAAKAGGSAGGSSSGTKPDTVSIEIKFIIVSNGNVTPTWHLVRVAANTGSTPFFGVGRTRNHDVIITIGPTSAATDNTHLASQIGNSVSSGNRLLQNP